MHKRLIAPILFLITITASLTTQMRAQSFTGQALRFGDYPSLSAYFEDAQVYRLDATELYQMAQQSSNSNINLAFGAHQWELSLQPNPILSSSYFARAIHGSVTTTLPWPTVQPYKGYTTAGGKVRLTVDMNLIYGMIQDGEDWWYIEPVWYLDNNAPRDLYVVYNRDNVKKTLDAQRDCAALEHEEMIQHYDDEPHEHHEDEPEQLACFQVDLAIASDASMLTKYGSEPAVEAHNVAVINNVTNDYSGSFNHELQFNIVTQVVSSTNPWGANANAGTYLGNFRNWGNAGNFGVTFDLGEMWTDIDLNGSTIGIAFLSAVCTSNKYHVLQDFSNNAELLRCLTSHEIGHNFAAVHDNCTTPDFIMCPFVSTSNDWSNASVASISGHITSRINNGCLQPCSSGPPPTADFSWDPDPGCVAQPVSFTDNSTGNIFTRNWVFQGGSPAASTAQNPTVTWNTPGIKNITLTLNTGTSSQVTLTQQITIFAVPTANFNFTFSGLTYNFNGIATNATSFLWDFGDGETSTLEDPQYTYTNGGIYTVTFTAQGPCTSVTRTIPINTLPVPSFFIDQQTGCVPDNVVFANTSSNNATSFSWQFPGGVPATSNLTNPSVTYNTPGQYNVVLTATNITGSQTVTETNYVVMGIAPVANFTFIPNGNNVSFFNQSINGITYLWNFGDGTTSTNLNPTHTYAAGGTYTVTLAVTNNCGEVTHVRTVVLATAPAAGFTATPTTGCGPLSVQYQNSTTSTTSGAITYQWQFPGGTPATSTAANPTVTYTQPGTYSATLVATNSGGSNTASQTNIITVLGPPATAFTSAANGLQATFTNTTTGGTIYSWQFGNGSTSTATNPSHIYATPGTYTVTLTAANDCGTTTATQTVTVIQAPTAAASASVVSGCAPFTTTFNSSSTDNPTSLAWQFPGGTPSTSTAANPVVTYSLPGTYSVVLTATNAAGSGSVTLNNYITVTGPPTSAAFAANVAGRTASFQQSAVGATSYSWQFGDGGTSSTTNPNHTYAADGNYTVTLTATNGCGSLTSTQSVTIVTPPIANFTAANRLGCAALTVQFTNASSPNATAFNWSFPGGQPATSTDPNPTVVYGAPGNFNVTLIASNSAGNVSVTQNGYVTVTSTPVAAFTQATTGALATFTNTSSGASSYLWNFGDGNTSTAASPTHTYANDGNYSVTLTATNSCGSTTYVETLTVATPPTAAFSSAVSSGCAPLTVQFTNQSSPNSTNYNWTFNGGIPATSTEPNPTVVFNSPGIYGVSLITTNAIGQSGPIASTQITVLSTPTALFDFTIDTATAIFTNNSVDADSYVWDFGDGNTSTEAFATHTYAADGPIPSG
jgi:PKD repeat protein